MELTHTAYLYYVLRAIPSIQWYKNANYCCKDFPYLEFPSSSSDSMSISLSSSLISNKLFLFKRPEKLTKIFYEVLMIFVRHQFLHTMQVILPKNIYIQARILARLWPNPAIHFGQKISLWSQNDGSGLKHG